RPRPGRPRARGAGGGAVPALQGRRGGAGDHRRAAAAEPGGQQRAPGHPRAHQRAARAGRERRVGGSECARPARIPIDPARPARIPIDPGRGRHAVNGRGRYAPLAALALLALAPALVAGLGAGERAPSLPAASLPPPGATSAGVRFTDVTAKAGIHFVHNSGRAGKKYLPETLGPGCAFFDADGDGWLDILFVNGRDWKPGGRRSAPAPYLNNHDGTFREATRGSGLDVEMYGMGVAVGDYDNDGRDDLYITALDGDRLFHNEGGGRFRDVTAEAGIHNAGF